MENFKNKMFNMIPRTKLGLLNFFFLQWFCIRLCKVSSESGLVRWIILRWIVPMTGWESDYIWIARQDQTIKEFRKLLDEMN